MSGLERKELSEEMKKVQEAQEIQLWEWEEELGEARRIWETDGIDSNIYFMSAFQCKPLYTGLYWGQCVLLAKLVESLCS